MTRALALWFCKKELPQRRKVVKQVKFVCVCVFFKRVKNTAYVDRHTSRLRQRIPELRLSGSLNQLYGAFLLVFLWSVILICLAHSPYSVYLRILPCLCIHLIDRLILLQRCVGRASLYIVPPLTSKEPLCVCVPGEVS